MPGKILIIVHQENSTPGRVGIRLRQRGYKLDTRRPVLGDELPATLDEHEGVIIFGGPMSANDDDIAGVRREIDWLEVPLKENRPFLGLCLGAQMLARHLGAEVRFHKDCYAEIGYYPITPTARGIELYGEWPPCVYQWHREGFDLPHGAELLATGEQTFPNQAFLYADNAVGLQFHPEVTLAMVHRWTVKAARRFSLPNVRPRLTHFNDRLVYDAKVDAWLDRLLDAWLG